MPIRESLAPMDSKQLPFILSSVEGYIKFHRGFLEDACKMMKGNVD